MNIHRDVLIIDLYYLQELYLIASTGVPSRQVRNAERFSWAVTWAVNDDILLEKLPVDIQRDIRHHFFSVVKKVSSKKKFCSIMEFVYDHGHNIQLFFSLVFLCHPLVYSYS